MQALQRAVYAASYGGRGVVKVGGTGISAGAGAVAAHFGEESVGVAREFVLESLKGRAEHDLGVVVVRRGVEGADTVSVCRWTLIERSVSLSLYLGGGSGAVGVSTYRRASRMVRSGTSVESLSFSL